MAAEPRTQPSASALNVARCRAIAAHESREEIKGPDHLAELFLSLPERLSLTNPAVFPLILRKLNDVSPGGYEYFIARTAYFDAVVKQALHDHIPQIVLIGAGYDTRAYRFADLLGGTRVFELDDPFTQAHKRGLLTEAGVAIPPQLTYVGLDLARVQLADALIAAGYAPEHRALFIWEGVTYYLAPEAVDRTLAAIRDHALAGSIVGFDYMLPESQLEGRYGAQQSRAAMGAMYGDEPLQFDLDEAQIEAFLQQRGYTLIEHLNARQLEACYLTLQDQTLAGKVLDLFRIVQAGVAG